MNQHHSKAVLKLNSLSVRRSASFELKVNAIKLCKCDFVCLVGANGSGKTTLLESIVGLIETPRDTVKILSQDPGSLSAAKSYIGYIPDDDDWIISELTAKEYFDLLNSIYRQAGVKHDMTAELKMLSNQLLFNSFEQQLGSLSHGNRKKVQIIAALMHRPPLLVVDELRNGLDPIVIKRAEDLLKATNRNGTAILAATHDLWWAERLALNVIIIRDGCLVLEKPVEEIVQQFGSLETAFLDYYGGKAYAS